VALGDVDRDGPDVEPLATVEIDDLDDILSGSGVHSPALSPRIHERVLADFRQDAGLPDCRCAM
jgi:hypothetical protein